MTTGEISGRSTCCQYYRCIQLHVISAIYYSFWKHNLCLSTSICWDKFYSWNRHVILMTIQCHIEMMTNDLVQEMHKISNLKYYKRIRVKYYMIFYEQSFF